VEKREEQEEPEEDVEERRERRRREQDQRKAEVAELLISMGANVNARDTQYKIMFLFKHCHLFLILS
jgi:hypothetical protein